MTCAARAPGRQGLASVPGVRPSPCPPGRRWPPSTSTARCPGGVVGRSTAPATPSAAPVVHPRALHLAACRRRARRRRRAWSGSSPPSAWATCVAHHRTGSTGLCRAAHRSHRRLLHLHGARRRAGTRRVGVADERRRRPAAVAGVRQLAFQAGRIVGFFVLGAALGAVGLRLALPIARRRGLMAVVAVFMILLGCSASPVSRRGCPGWSIAAGLVVDRPRARREGAVPYSDLRRRRARRRDRSRCRAASPRSCSSMR